MHIPYLLFLGSTQLSTNIWSTQLCGDVTLNIYNTDIYFNVPFATLTFDVVLKIFQCINKVSKFYSFAINYKIAPFYFY